MTARLAKADAGDFASLGEDMLNSNEAHDGMEVAVEERKAPKAAGTEIKRRVKKCSALRRKGEMWKGSERPGTATGSRLERAGDPSEASGHAPYTR